MGTGRDISSFDNGEKIVYFLLETTADVHFYEVKKYFSVFVRIITAFGFMSNITGMQMSFYK